MSSYRFLPGADEDYQEAFDWYHEQSKQAAIGFEDAVREGLKQIVESPNRWPQLDRRHRNLVLDRYPFSLVYRLTQNEIVIVAIAHAKRRPGYWHRRKD